MNHEIEAKIKVPSLDGFENKLKELGADFIRMVYQADTYFMDTHKLLHKNDCGLRIRQQVIDGNKTALITFKGARKDTKFKTRPEYETGIDNVEMTENIFDALGYHKRLTVEKDRAMWRLDGCDVCLDTLPELGCFVEVEGNNEESIESVLEKLELHNEPHITESYARMTMQAMRSNVKTEAGQEA
jgi:adenylate cyclase class 2